LVLPSWSALLKEPVEFIKRRHARFNREEGIVILFPIHTVVPRPHDPARARVEPELR